MKRFFLGVLFCAAAAVAQPAQNPENPSRSAERSTQSATRERSPTLNNGAIRDSERPATADEKFEQLPGGSATPRGQWRTGDERGKPPQARRKHHKRHSGKELGR